VIFQLSGFRRCCCGSGFSPMLTASRAVLQSGDFGDRNFFLFASRDPLFEFEFDGTLFAFA
jgi:hypothetical protein